MTPLKQIVYLSRLTDPRGPAVVPAIIRHARSRNPTHGITGALVFDGESFCQFLEGGSDEIDIVFGAISADTRHADVRLIYRGQAEARRFRVWSMAFATPVHRFMIDTLSARTLEEIPQAFVDALAQCDVEV